MKAALGDVRCIEARELRRHLNLGSRLVLPALLATIYMRMCVETAIGGRIEGRTDNATRGITTLVISIMWYVTFVLSNIIDNTDEASRFVKLNGQRR